MSEAVSTTNFLIHDANGKRYFKYYRGLMVRMHGGLIGITFIIHYLNFF